MTHDHVTGEVVITATEFKAKCLDILDQVQSRKLSRVTVTKRGKPVAVVTQPEPEEAFDPYSIFGCMKGTVTIPEGVDIVGPIFEGEILAEKGILHL